MENGDRQHSHPIKQADRVSVVSESAESSSALVPARDRARDRSDRERRRVVVARLRWIESNLTAAEIATALSQLNPPIIVSPRTVERDCQAIRDDSRRYLTAVNFDARFEVGAALMRHEMIARMAAQHALGNHADGAKWARVAILATEAKTQLLQDIGLIDRRIGTLFIDDSKNPDRIPSGVEMQRRFDGVNVVDADLVSEAERAFKFGDSELAERIDRDAKRGISRPTNGNGNGSR
jgi:hypothetical protein